MNGPLSAVTVSDEINDLFKSDNYFIHGFTDGGHPVSAARFEERTSALWYVVWRTAPVCYEDQVNTMMERLDDTLTQWELSLGV
jgi:hypothetical protein